jgi:hypothetical protein
MQFLIATLASLVVFILFFAVFFIKRREKDEPVKVHTCAREKCNSENKTGEIQIQERIKPGP